MKGKIFTVTEKYKNSNWKVSAVLKDFRCEGLLSILEESIPYRLFRNARASLTGEDECLEIKGMADEVVSVKSRGQIGLLNSGHVTILAKFSVKPPFQEIITDPELRKFIYEDEDLRRQTEGEWLLNEVEATMNGRDEIVTYHLYTLPTGSMIMKSKGQLDLVQQKAERRFNCDYDMKRLPLLVGTSLYEDGPLLSPPYTLPFGTLKDMKNHREQSENIRRGPNGRVARLEEVLHRIKVRGKRTRSHGGEAAATVRLFMRGLMQGVFAGGEPAGPYQEIAKRLADIWAQLPLQSQGSRKSWSGTDLKNAARGEWEANTLRRTVILEQLVDNLSKGFGVDRDEACSLLFLDDAAGMNKALVLQVVKAILRGRRLEPFKRLLMDGRLPGRDDLLLAFSPLCTTEMLSSCESSEFIPGGRPSYERPALVQLFRRVGLAAKDAAECAKVIAPPPAELQKTGENPAGKACLESFVTCILQPDFVLVRLAHSRILSSLRSFDLKAGVFESLRRDRFIPRRLSNTAANRTQIRRMAQRLRIDPAPILAAVIDW